MFDNQTKYFKLAVKKCLRHSPNLPKPKSLTQPLQALIVKGIDSRDFGVLFLFIWIDMKFLIGTIRNIGNIRFGAADPGIVTIRRIFRKF
jgi:hypothetical protein